MTLRHPLALVNTLTFLSVLLSPLVLLALSFSPYFLFRITNHFFSLCSPIYSLRWVEALWLLSDLTCVGGVQSNYFWWDHALLGTVIMASELVPTSKRLLGSNILQGNIKLSRTQAVLSKHIPDQVKIDRQGLASDTFKTRWTHYGTWA